MIKNLVMVAMLFFATASYAENSKENSPEKVRLTWDVTVTSIYDQITNKITRVDDVASVVTSEFYLAELEGIQINDYIYEVHTGPNQLRSEIGEANYDPFGNSALSEVYKIKDTYQGLDIDFHWAFRNKGMGYRYDSSLFIKGSFQGHDFDKSDDYNAIKHLELLIGHSFIFYENGTFKVSYGERGGKQYRGHAILRSVETFIE